MGGVELDQTRRRSSNGKAKKSRPSPHRLMSPAFTFVHRSRATRPNFSGDRNVASRPGGQRTGRIERHVPGIFLGWYPSTRWAFSGSSGETEGQLKKTEGQLEKYGGDLHE